MTAPAIRVLSLGAGVQSTALALLSAEGRLPKLDHAIFADTGWEPPAVYAQFERIAVELRGAGTVVHRVSTGNLRDDSINPAHRYASIPYYVLGPAGSCERCEGVGQLPVEEDRVTAEWWPAWRQCPDCKGDGRSRGLGRRQCTSEYKLAPIGRKVRELLGAAAPDFRRVPKGRVAEQWIGFSADELHRISDKNGVSYSRKRYPLLELDGVGGRTGWDRADCQRYLAGRGYGATVKSACVGCPFHGNRQWRDMRDMCDCGHRRKHHYDRFGNLPSEESEGMGRCALCGCDEFAASGWDDAVAFDEAIRKGGARGLPLDGEAFLHASRIPLASAPIDRVTAKEWAGAQGDVFDTLEDGEPDGCSPYGCRSGASVDGSVTPVEAAVA